MAKKQKVQDMWNLRNFVLYFRLTCLGTPLGTGPRTKFGRGSVFTVRLPVKMTVSDEQLLSASDDTAVGMNRVKSADLIEYVPENLTENKQSDTHTP